MEQLSKCCKRSDVHNLGDLYFCPDCAAYRKSLTTDTAQPCDPANPTPKDGQKIDEILDKYHEGILANGTEPPEWWERQGEIKRKWFKQAIEAYCENERRKAVEEYIASQKEGNGTK